MPLAGRPCGALGDVLWDVLWLGVIASLGCAGFASPFPGITIMPLESPAEEDASAASARASRASAAARMAALAPFTARA